MDGDRVLEDPALEAAYAALAAELGVAVPAVRTVEGLGHLYEGQLDRTARSHAGVHYTPRALAEEVVEHALAPLTHDADGVVLPVEQLLDLRIADIAAGTGAFLIAAARYLAARVAEAGGDEPLRTVVSTCLYGADLDPRAVQLCRTSLALLAGDAGLVGVLERRILHGDALLDAAPRGVDRPTIDWFARLPEIAERGGFDAVIGNPPFLGVKRIRAAVGAAVRDAYADTLLAGGSGRSDLVVFFLARAGRLSRRAIAFVLPEAVLDGDTARFGIGWLREHGWTVVRQDTSRPWPGQAGVRICVVWLEKRERAGRLDRLNHRAHRRSSVSRPRPTWMPHGHQASIVLGRSLLLTPEEAEAMVAEDPRAAAWIHDYLSGDDLVSTCGPTSSRRVLDLGATDLATLDQVAPIARRLVAVRAERDAQLATYPQLAARWWGFLNRVDRLYDEIGDRAEVIAMAKHAKYLWPVLVRTGPVFSNGAIVYPSGDRAVYGFLASTPHRLWAITEGGSRLNQSHRYNPSRLLRSYPFPASIDGVREPGAALADAVRAACDELGVGITAVLNRVHGGDDHRLVGAVREAWAEVDRAVLDAHRIAPGAEEAVLAALRERASADEPR